MRKWYLLFVFFGIAGMSGVWAQDNVTEAYFHELQGMEDSSGVTHLFYRLYYKYSRECTYTDYQDSTQTVDVSLHSNNVHHYNTENRVEELTFREGPELWAECSTTYRDVPFFLPYNNDPNKLFKLSTSDAHWSFPGLSDWRGNTIDIGASPANVFALDTIKSHLLVPTGTQDIIIKASSQPPNLGKTIRAQINGSNWSEIGFYEEVPDSLLINFTILGINPYSNKEYLGVRNDSLFRSINHGDSLSFVLKNDLFGSQFPRILFDKEKDIYFFITDLPSKSPSLKKRVWRLSLETEEPLFDEIHLEQNFRAISSDPYHSGHVFVADSSGIFYSEDFGHDFNPFISLNQAVTGLYKKPDSDFLYVLTREELLKVNIETKTTTSLKTIPVSNEPEPSNIPNQITLEQNYPNPFNPTTVISYQLDSNQLVRLEVFDVTGRKVATLVNGDRQAVGNHRITFEASGLSSGVYFYRLETGGQTLTRKMLLVK